MTTIINVHMMYSLQLWKQEILNFGLAYWCKISLSSFKREMYNKINFFENKICKLFESTPIWVELVKKVWAFPDLIPFSLSKAKTLDRICLTFSTCINWVLSISIPLSLLLWLWKLRRKKTSWKKLQLFFFR